MISAGKQNTVLNHIQTGKPQQNAYVERCNRRVRREWLNLYVFETIEEAHDFATTGYGLTSIAPRHRHRRPYTRQETEDNCLKSSFVPR